MPDFTADPVPSVGSLTTPGQGKDATTELEPLTVEYAVLCEDGVGRHNIATDPDPEVIAAIADLCDAEPLPLSCGPHTVVQRSVGPWQPVNSGDSSIPSVLGVL